MNMNDLTDILMRKKPDTKAHILCGSVYYAVREQTKLIYGDGNQMHGYLEWGIIHYIRRDTCTNIKIKFDDFF